MEIDGQKDEVVPQAEMTSENYYFDSYSHFGERYYGCKVLAAATATVATPPAAVPGATLTRVSKDRPLRKHKFSSPTAVAAEA